MTLLSVHNVKKFFHILIKGMTCCALEAVQSEHFFATTQVCYSEIFFLWVSQRDSSAYFVVRGRGKEIDLSNVSFLFRCEIYENKQAPTPKWC